MARFTALALLGAIAAANARTHMPETSAELASAFMLLRSGDTIKLKAPMYTTTQQLNITQVFGIKVEGAHGGSVIKANKKTRILYIFDAQSISLKNVVFSNGRVDVNARRAPAACARPPA